MRGECLQVTRICQEMLRSSRALRVFWMPAAVASLLLAPAPDQAAAQIIGEWLDLQVDPDPQEWELVDALAMGQTIDLDAPEGLLLWVRLISVPREAACVPEGHFICAHSYYLATTAYGEQPDTQVYGLGTLGEILSHDWVREPTGDGWRLRLVVLNAAQHLFESHPTLEPKRRQFELDIGFEAVKLIASSDLGTVRFQPAT